jgi:hypothetical protein
MGTYCWSLTSSAVTIMGTATDHDAAVTFVLAAAQAAIDQAGRRAVPPSRYELRVDTQLIALIQTGTDEAGSPDHTAASALIARIEAQRSLSAAPY